MTGVRKMAIPEHEIVNDLLETLKIVDLSSIPDPRKEKNKKWPQTALLKAVLCSLAVGKHNLRETEQFTVDLHPHARKAIGLNARVPATTIRDLLVRLDPHDIRKLVQQQCRLAVEKGQISNGKFPFGVVSVDGKWTTIKQTSGRYVQERSNLNNQGVIRTMTSALISGDSTLCLDANPIPAQTNEMGWFQNTITDLLKAYGDLNLFRLIRADAGLQSKANAEFLVNNGLHFCFALKSPNNKLLKEAKRKLEDIDEQLSEGSTIDRQGKNKSVVRMIFKTEELSGTELNPNVRTVIRIQRMTLNIEKNETTNCENYYFISDLPWEALTVDQWLALVRDHWKIENNVHWTLDTPFEEDSRPWITSSEDGFLVVALLRRLAYNLITLKRDENPIKRGKRYVKVAWETLTNWFWVSLCRLGVYIDTASAKMLEHDITL